MLTSIILITIIVDTSKRSITPGHSAGTTSESLAVLFSSYARQEPIPGFDDVGDYDRDAVVDDDDGDEDGCDDFHLLASTRFSSRLIQATNQETYF